MCDTQTFKKFIRSRPTAEDAIKSNVIVAHFSGCPGHADVKIGLINEFKEQLGKLPSSAVPSSAVPSSAVPSSAVPSSAVPSSAVPSSAVPSSAVSSSDVSFSVVSSVGNTVSLQNAPLNKAEIVDALNKIKGLVASIESLI